MAGLQQGREELAGGGGSSVGSETSPGDEDQKGPSHQMLDNGPRATKRGPGARGASRAAGGGKEMHQGGEEMMQGYK